MENSKEKLVFGGFIDIGAKGVQDCLCFSQQFGSYVSMEVKTKNVGIHFLGSWRPLVTKEPKIIQAFLNGFKVTWFWSLVREKYENYFFSIHHKVEVRLSSLSYLSCLGDDWTW